MTQQPMASWMSMPMPKDSPNCPPGLEYLTIINQLLVQQKINLLEERTLIEIRNKYTIMNSLGQKMYYAFEESHCCSKSCCVTLRPFHMKILNNYLQEVMHFTRKRACDCCCFPCCLQKIEVSAPPGALVGTVRQKWSIYPSFTIRDPAGNVVLRIRGPCCCCRSRSCCRRAEFKVMSANGRQQIGRIFRQLTGVPRESFIDAKYFEITFPMDLDVRMKAVVLGACFLIDAMFYEN